MRKVELRMNEQLKYETIKEPVDHHGNKRRAALKLNLSIRQVNRLINVYKAKGKAGFVHGNRNRRPANSLPQELGRKIIALYEHDYQDFNFKHYTDLCAFCHSRKQSENNPFIVGFCAAWKNNSVFVLPCRSD